jgi:hypothetical protein
MDVRETLVIFLAETEIFFPPQFPDQQWGSSKFYPK